MVFRQNFNGKKAGSAKKPDLACGIPWEETSVFCEEADNEVSKTGRRMISQDNKSKSAKNKEFNSILELIVTCDSGERMKPVEKK